MTATFAPGVGVANGERPTVIGAVGWDGLPCPDDLRLLSASSVPKALAAPALERWAITRTIEKLAERLPQFAAMVAHDLDAAVDWADQLRYEPDVGAELNAADSGTAMHSLLECWLKGETVPPALAAQVQSDIVLYEMANLLWTWFCRFKPEPVAMERVVYWPEAGLAGRFDAIVRFPLLDHLGNVLLDLKTSRQARTKAGTLKRVYGDAHALQLASYRYATHVATFEPRLLITQRATSTRTYLVNPRELAVCDPMWQIDSSVVVSLNPERCAAHPVDTGQGVRRRVLEAVGLHHWVHVESRDVVGQPLTVPIDLPELTP